MIDKVITINDFSDPYEPPFQVAICTSMEEVMKLGLKHLWKVEPNSTHTYHMCTDLITNEIKMVPIYDFTPTPFVEEVEVNKILIEGEDIKYYTEYLILR